MKSFVTIAISLLLAATSTIAQGGAQKTVAVRENIERAEQLADRFVQRFRETLDFEVVYREFFIVDPEKRLRNSSLIVFDSEQHEELKKKMSPSETEQAYIGFMNLYYLVALYVSNILTEEEENSSKLKAEELFPPELLKAIKEPSICFFFDDYLGEEACKETSELFQTADEARQFVKNANHLAALLRKYMPPEPFDSPKYKAYIKQLERNGRETGIEQGDGYFGVGVETTVYEIYRELFALNVVEENGEMKVVGIPIGN